MISLPLDIASPRPFDQRSKTTNVLLRYIRRPISFIALVLFHIIADFFIEQVAKEAKALAREVRSVTARSFVTTFRYVHPFHSWHILQKDVLGRRIRTAS